MKEHPEVDAVLVGKGFTASVIAHQLTEAGMEVVSLERGRSQWTYPDFAHNHDCLKYNQRYAMMQDLSEETWTWRPNRNARSLPYREFGSKTVGPDLGGTGAHWAGGAWRFLPTDFNYRTHHIERYGIDKLPEHTTVQDWPLTYDELEPFYDRFEYDQIWNGHHDVLAQYRAHRLFTPTQRRAILARDRGCQAPGCTVPAVYCQIHHIIEWLNDGTTNTDNAVTLCAHHHGAVHNGKWTIRKHHGTTYFQPAPWLDPTQPLLRNLYWAL